MLTSKIHTSIITAAAALSILAVGPMTPVASALKKEPPKKESARCIVLKGKWEQAWEIAEQANRDGDDVKFKNEVEFAGEVFENARALHCAWAVYETAPPSRTEDTLPTPLPVEQEEAPASTKVEKPSTNQSGPSTLPLTNG